jgi:hypothetical protein
MFGFLSSLFACCGQKLNDEPDEAPQVQSPSSRRVPPVNGMALDETIPPGESSPFWARFLMSRISTSTKGKILLYIN